MRIRNLVCGLTLLTSVLSSWPAGACGDKLLILGRGVRFQVDKSDFPAAILLFMNPEYPGSSTWGDSQLQAIMKNAGHRLKSVRSREELAAELKAKFYDIVLADLADAPRVEELVQAAPSHPVLLPWVYQGTNASQAAAKKQYQFYLKAPGSVAKFLSVIDRTMEQKSKLVRLRSNSRARQISLLK